MVNSDINAVEISQEEAYTLYQSLTGDALYNFSIGFEDESLNKQMFSPDKRRYYKVSLRENPYLLVGINHNYEGNLAISSVAKISIGIYSMATNCMVKLIEDFLVPFARHNNKHLITARAITKNSKRMFRKIAETKIRGIKESSFLSNQSFRLDLD